jgi:hypothetical protein
MSVLPSISAVMSQSRDRRSSPPCPSGYAPGGGSSPSAYRLPVIDVHGREAALVVIRVPERKLLTAMRRAERVVDVEDLLLARLHCRAGLIDESCGEPPPRSCSAHSGRWTGSRRMNDRTSASVASVVPSFNTMEWYPHCVSFGSQRACFGFRGTIAMGDF